MLFWLLTFLYLSTKFNDLVIKMKVRLVFVFYVFSSFISIYGNTPTPDQIEQKLDECYTILIEKNPEDAFHCLERIKPEILQSGYGKGIVRFYTQLSEYYLFKGEHQKSLDLISEGLKKHEELLSEEEQNRFQVLEIRILQELGNDQEVLQRIQDLLPDIQSPRHKAALLLNVDDPTSFAGVRLYPNPLNAETFYVHAPMLNGKEIEIRIADISGRQIYNRTLQSTSDRIEVSVNDTLSSGVYLVTIKHAGELKTYRLIRE